MKQIFNKLKMVNETVIVCIVIVASVFLFAKNKDGGQYNALISQGKSSISEEPKEEIVDPLKYAHIIPVEPGTKWIYEGKRIWYDNELDPGLTGKAQETIGQKIIEIKSIKKEGDNLRVFVSVSYKNNPEDFGVFEKSFLLSESGYAFDGTNLSYFPLVKGQHLGPNDSYFERTDNYYVSYVYSLSKKYILGKHHRCYDIVYDTLPDESLDTFCEGVGYIRDSYTHHGTPGGWDYHLIRIEHPVLNK